MRILKLFIRSIFVYLFAVIFLVPFGAVYADNGTGLYSQSVREAPREVSSDGVKSPEPIMRSVDSSYRLGIDDSFKITVSGEPDLSGSFTVASNGTISYPLIGEIRVQGLSVSAAARVLQEKLSDGYLVNPSVSAEMLSYRRFYILGEVRIPGSYSYSEGMTVSQAAALAGGFTYRADKKYVQVLKTRDPRAALRDKVPIDNAIMPGDVVLVKERFF